MNKSEFPVGQSNSTLQLATTAMEAAAAGRKKPEWIPPTETCKTAATLDYLASFHSSQ